MPVGSCCCIDNLLLDIEKAVIKKVGFKKAGIEMLVLKKQALERQVLKRQAQRLNNKANIEKAGKSSYCLQYWREEYQIFIKFGKVFYGALHHQNFFVKYSFNYLW